MFDFHMHSTVSFDGHGAPPAMAEAAAKAGLREICFTDHIDNLFDDRTGKWMTFATEDYRAAYDGLSVPGLTIRKGLEFGLTPDNPASLKADLERYPFDFVIGSVHAVEGQDVYWEPFWRGRTVEQSYRRYLEEMLSCVQAHRDYDVLGHLTFVCKCRDNPTKQPLRWADYPELIDSILLELVHHDKGLEVNTSGIDRCGDFLPGADILRRFRELGGSIVTVGSDAHTPDRVGQYTEAACALAGEIFGHVCTFSGRQPVFHRI